MADYIYLLENRLSPTQRTALRVVRDLARAQGLTLFLVGGAVRDLTSGSPVRDLDVVVQGDALKLRKDIERAGGVISGELEAGQALYVVFPGSVRMEVGSTLSLTFPKPGKPVVKPATILEDLRRRDFTANAMALSLNEGSYGLLMDPLNGVADIENRQLRLVSNYGFIEDPVRMIRAARLMARLGWTLDERTQGRYETGKQEGYIAAMQDFHRGYETEEIVHEEDPLRVLKRLEAEGWMAHLAPFWTSAKVNVAELERMRAAQTQLQMQGIHPDPGAANFPLLTAKLSAKEIATLKAGFPRQGFVREIEALEGQAKEFGAQLGGKAGMQPSQAWKLLTSAAPETVLWMAFSTKSPALQAKLKSFYAEWPQARQKMPYALMQEMRITTELAGYEELLERLFFELMDGRLTTAEEMKAFLEPYSPPAPPPPVNMRRLRAAKKEVKGGKGRAKKAAVVDDDEEAIDPIDAEELAEAAEADESAEIAEALSDDTEEAEEAEDTEPSAPGKSTKAKAGGESLGGGASEARQTGGEISPAVRAADPMKKVTPAAAKKQATAMTKPVAASSAAVKTGAVKTGAVKTGAVKTGAVKTAAAVKTVAGAPAKKVAAPAKKVVAVAKKVASPQKAAAAQNAAAKAPATKAAPPLPAAKPKKASERKPAASPAKKAQTTPAKAVKKATGTASPVKQVAKIPVKAGTQPVKVAAKKVAPPGKPAAPVKAKRR